jgi:O-antigen/teichoic acid export membrane protein
MVMLLGEEQYSVLLSYVCNFKSTLINSGQDFFKYGITRLPNNFFFGSLFFIPVVIASNYCDLKTAAYVGVLLTIIRMLQILALPINIIVVPKIAELKSLTKHSEIKEHANNILHFILSAPMWIGLYVMLFAREVILIWFGEKYSVLISSIEWVGAISGFLLVFVVIRGMLDGISSRPYINYITFVAFAVLITSFLLKGLQNTDYHSIALAFGISLTTLGLSSVIFYTLVFKLSIVNKINFYLASWYFISIFIMNYVAKYCHQYEFVTSLAVKIIIGAVYLFVSLIFLNYLQVGWIKELKQRFSL